MLSLEHSPDTQLGTDMEGFGTEDTEPSTFYISAPDEQDAGTNGGESQLACQCCDRFDIRHIRQRDDWDCGVACLQMVCSMLGLPYTYGDIALQCGTDSIWTIDMLLALRRCGVRAQLQTTASCAHPDHANNSFYTQIFERDQIRVDAQFDQAREAGLIVERRMTSLELQDSICLQDQVAIVLVDALTLKCSSCPPATSAKVNDVEKDPDADGEEHPNDYQGHYIVVIGYDYGRQDLLYVDPACDQPRCHISVDALESARAVQGTDHDIIIVQSNQQVVLNSYYQTDIF